MSRVGENIKKARLDAKLNAKTVAKKLGISEGNLLDIESGKKVINEAMISRLSKILNKDINSMGLSSFETESLKEEVQNRKVISEKPIFKKAEKKEKVVVNELWDQAFGNNLRNVPILDLALKVPQGTKTYPIHNGKIENEPMEKVFCVKAINNELKGFNIPKDSLLLARDIKEIINEGFYLIEIQGQRLIRKCRNLGNGNIQSIKYEKEEIASIIPSKEIKVFAKFFKVEIKL